MLERTRESLESSQVVMKNGYPYVINPILDGIPRMDPEILNEITDRMMEICEFDCDVILAPEAMAIPFAVAVSIRTGIPYSVIRKRSYGCNGEVSIDKSTGYASSTMFINGIRPGERIVLIDDVVSTGGTLKSIVEAIEGMGCEIVEVVVAVDKSTDLAAVSKDLGHPIKATISMTLVDGKPVCKY